MKKEDVSGIIVYLLILAIAVVFGITVLLLPVISSLVAVLMIALQLSRES